MPDSLGHVQKIALGTVQFGTHYGISNSSGKTDVGEVERILAFCGERGINTIDTAFAYGNSETVLGCFDLSSFRIVSKFLPAGDSIPTLGEQLKISLDRLKIGKLYGYLAHRPREVAPRQWEHLQTLKQQGLIEKIGFSFSDPGEIRYVLDKGLIPDLVQAPFNFLDNRFVELLKSMKERYRTEVHTRSAFLQGLFFMDPSGLPDFFDPVRKTLKQINGLSNKGGLLLRYTLSPDFVDRVVVGVNNLAQLADNLLQLEQAAELLSPNREEYPSECLTPSQWPVS